MTFSATQWLVFIAAYLLGSISTAVIVCRLLSLPDPRLQGSKNPGATNVLRIGGKKAAALTLVGDALKGVIPVALARFLGFDDLALAITALLAFLGHLYPVFFSFKGGKGVATAVGVILVISWQSGICLIATWLLIAKIFRISSLAALIAATLAPPYIWYWEKSVPLLVLSLVISLLLIWRHKSNIQKLMSGAEDKINDKG